MEDTHAPRQSKRLNGRRVTVNHFSKNVEANSKSKNVPQIKVKFTSKQANANINNDKKESEEEKAEVKRRNLKRKNYKGGNSTRKIEKDDICKKKKTSVFDDVSKPRRKIFESDTCTSKQSYTCKKSKMDESVKEDNIIKNEKKIQREPLGKDKKLIRNGTKRVKDKENENKNQEKNLEVKSDKGMSEMSEVLDEELSSEKENKSEESINKDGEGESDNDTESFSCKVCSKDFKSRIGLTQHMSKTHGLFCRACRIQFDDKEEFHKHELEEHKIFHFENGKKMFQCDICSKLCKDRTKLECHLQSHNSEPTYKCEICGKMLKTETTLKYHVKIMHDTSQQRGHKCDVCGKEFWNNSELKKHSRVHSNDRPFLCQFCSLGFKTIGNLSNHEQAIHGTKKYSCEICGKGFTSKKKSLEHCFEKKYSTQKPPPIKSFECEKCGKMFARKNDMKIHFRIHTGDKPYECTVCKKLFRCGNHLKQHRVIHTGEKPFKCKHCNKGFSQIANVRCHMKKCKLKLFLVLEDTSLTNEKVEKDNLSEQEVKSANSGSKESNHDDTKSNKHQITDDKQTMNDKESDKSQKTELLQLFAGSNDNENSPLVSLTKTGTTISTLNVCEKGTQSEIVYPSTKERKKVPENKSLPTIIFVDGNTAPKGFGKLRSLFKEPILTDEKGDEFRPDLSNQISLDGEHSAENNLGEESKQIVLQDGSVEHELSPFCQKSDENGHELSPFRQKNEENGHKLTPFHQKSEHDLPPFVQNIDQVSMVTNEDINIPPMTQNDNLHIPQSELHVHDGPKEVEGESYLYKGEPLCVGNEIEHTCNTPGKSSEVLYDSTGLQNIILIPGLSGATHTPEVTDSGTSAVKTIQIPIIDNESGSMVCAEIDDNGILRYVQLNDPDNTTTIILDNVHQHSDIESFFTVDSLNSLQTSNAESDQVM